MVCSDYFVVDNMVDIGRVNNSNNIYSVLKCVLCIATINRLGDIWMPRRLSTNQLSLDEVLNFSTAEL